MASSLEGNKIMAAVLTAGIVASASGVLSRLIYAPHELEEPVYKIAVAEEAAGGGEAAAEAEAQPIGVLLASANPEAGTAVAKKCASCHTFAQGEPNRVGPNLYNTVNRPVAQHEGFAYSDALKAYGGEWNYDRLSAFLANPKAEVPGTKMSFAGIAKDQERADLIAYLRTLSDAPVPLPGS
jgi:cytochrome c